MSFSCPIVTVKSVEPNPNADSLDVLTFDEIAWVTQDVRGKRKVGDKVVYIPIDAMVDCTRPEFAFLTKNAKMRRVQVGLEPVFPIDPSSPEEEAEWAANKENVSQLDHMPVYEMRPIARIKTIRLRGEVSQGLVIDVPPALVDILDKEPNDNGDIILSSGVDCATFFGVTKYEPPEEAVLSANAKAGFPAWCPRTDAERYQNVNRTLEAYADELYVMSIKLDGTSLTVFYDSLRAGDEYGVCSRNQELKSEVDDPQSADVTAYGFALNSFWRATVAGDFLAKAKAIAERTGNERVALQFELCGEGIQGNKMGLRGQRAYLFDIYVTRPGFEGYLDWDAMLDIVAEYGIETVPVRKYGIRLPCSFDFVNSLRYSSGQLAEGIVCVSVREKQVRKLGRLKFKYVSPAFLLEHEKRKKKKGDGDEVE